MILVKEAEQMLNEPGFRVFRHKGFLCAILRMPWGNLNGYVGLPKGHRCHGVDYNDIHSKHDVDVHGGLTFSSPELGAFEQGIFPDLWWIGFDTAHAWDIRPIQTDLALGYFENSTYKDFKYVETEVRNLAEQMEQINKDKATD